MRGLSDGDIESLASEARLGQISKSTVSEITKELRARYQAFRARSLREVELLALFCDAIYLPTRPTGGKKRVLVAWGYLERAYPSAAACRRGLAGALRAPRVPAAPPPAAPLDEPAGAVVGGGQAADEVIGTFPGEMSCLSLCWAVLDLFIASARGLGLTTLEHRQLAQMRAAQTAQTPDSQTA